jgi:hypothetical protein
VKRLVAVGLWVLVSLTLVFGVLGDAPGHAFAGTAGPEDFRLAPPTTQVLPAKAPGTGTDAVQGPFRALQLNLCHGGFAPCGDDSTLPETVALLRRLSGSGTPPDLISLNEICREDITADLVPAMADIWAADRTFFLFAPAVEIRAGDIMAPYPCANGDAYGNALVGHVPEDQFRGVDGLYGMYAAQSAETEKRSFGCLYLVGHYRACTTHLEAGDEPVAMNQCRTLMDKAIPYFLGRERVDLPILVAADLNLRDNTAGPYNVRNCVPPGYFRAGDGDVMHVLATGDFGFGRTDEFRLEHTDHNAFLATMTRP